MKLLARNAEIEMRKCIYCDAFVPAFERDICDRCQPKAEADMIIDNVLQNLEKAIRLVERTEEDVFSHREDEVKLLTNGFRALIERKKEEGQCQRIKKR